jgi:hypothetical protein
VLYQSFSLLAQSRSESPDLADLFRSEGIGAGSRVGVGSISSTARPPTPKGASRSPATSPTRCASSPALARR